MKYEQMENNRVVLTGEVISQPVFSHETFGENFYEINISVSRLSGKVDELPIIISEKLLADKRCALGNTICIKGQFRSYNKTVNDRSKLVLTIFARELAEPNEEINPNIIELAGFICKTPVYRTTPFKREICDILLAVNRAYNKSDYLPCIAWGRNARYIKDIEIGTKIFVVGRIQSREYQKKQENGEIETKIAYEVSISRIQTEESKNNVQNNEEKIDFYEDDDAINL